MKPGVYLETSVISYLVGRLSRDVVVLGNQELTREWWANRRGDYELFGSEIVVGEAGLGDPDLSRQRLEICDGLQLLAVSDEAERQSIWLRAASHLHTAGTDRKVTTMWEDPIVKETRTAREQLFAQFSYDLAKLCEHLRQKQREHGGRVVTREPRRPDPVETLEK